jgi:hypothetical protein
MVYEFRYGLGYENGNLTKKKFNHSQRKMEFGIII